MSLMGENATMMMTQQQQPASSAADDGREPMSINQSSTKITINLTIGINVHPTLRFIIRGHIKSRYDLMIILLTVQVIVTIMLQVVHSFPVLRRTSMSKRYLSVLTFNDRKVVRLSDILDDKVEVAERSLSWISKDHVKHDFKSDVPVDRFKVISYNVLGPWQGESSMHNYAPQSVTQWKNRKTALCAHLVELNADILCLQEVSSYSLKKVFQSALRKVGYELVGYSPARKHGLQSPTRHLHEAIGSAIFMKLEKFDVLERRRILLRDFAGHVLGDGAATTTTGSLYSKLLSDFRSKYHSMQIARMRVKATGQQFVIATTHLCWDPNQTDVKVLQAFAATQALRAFMAKQNLDHAASGHKHTKYGPTDAQDEEEDIADEAENEERVQPDEGELLDPPVQAVEVTATTSSNSAADEALKLLGPEELDSFVANIPLIFCGDLNSLPYLDDQEEHASIKASINPPPPASSPSMIRSGVMQLLSTGNVPTSHPHHPNQWRETMRQAIVNAAATSTTSTAVAIATETSTIEQQATESITPAQSVDDPSPLNLPLLRQPFQLKNIYDMEPFTQYQPRFSTKTDAFQGWIDHMWCSPHFTVEMVLRLPVTAKESEVDAETFPPIPSKAYPSDHLPIGAVFRLNL